MKRTSTTGIILGLLTLIGAAAQMAYAQAPVVYDHSYAAQQNETLTVNAPGLLDKRLQPIGRSLDDRDGQNSFG
jgi:hypothetical protein